jgi:hypothetical protein
MRLKIAARAADVSMFSPLKGRRFYRVKPTLDERQPPTGMIRIQHGLAKYSRPCCQK